MINEVVYIGRNNSIDWRLETDGTPADLSSLTRVQLFVYDESGNDAGTVSGTRGSQYFSWGTSGEEGFEGTRGRVAATLGLSPALGTLNGKYIGKFNLINDFKPQGVLWDRFIMIIEN